MSEISASLVKELREMTGLGMMECKKALAEAGGDLNKAEELLRIRSGAKASKAAGRIASEGVIGAWLSPAADSGALVELNCETDFVAKNADFLAFARSLAEMVAKSNPADVAALSAVPDEGGSVEARRQALVQDECESRTKEIRQSEKVLTGELLEGAKAVPHITVYVSVPGHFERIGGFIEAISRSMRTKIKEGLLFSDRAVSEISFLLKRTEEVLQNTGDMILARNIIIREYVKESAAEISRSANEFATMHEDRLIAGVCVPKASPLFLELMEAIKGIAWHAKEIAVALTPTGIFGQKTPLRHEDSLFMVRQITAVQMDVSAPTVLNKTFLHPSGYLPSASSHATGVGLLLHARRHAEELETAGLRNGGPWTKMVGWTKRVFEVF